MALLARNKLPEEQFFHGDNTQMNSLNLLLACWNTITGREQGIFCTHVQEFAVSRKLVFEKLPQFSGLFLILLKESRSARTSSVGYVDCAALA
jgi:hypothetical protein